MGGPKVHYSFSYNRELNLHRSKEQLEREFSKLVEHTSEFVEFAGRFQKDLKKYLSQYAGIKTIEMPPDLYIVIRDRGLSFPDPMTVVYDEDQKLMFVRYVNLIAQRYFTKPEEATCLTKWVCKKLPIGFEREIHELEQEQNIIVPFPYDLTEKPLKKWLK